MALGGGRFIKQNKILPGSYINFVSASKASSALSERGVLAMPLEGLSWGAEGEVFPVTAEEFEKNPVKYFGYPYKAEELKPIREVFTNIRLGYFYRLDTGGTKATSDLGDAKYSGVRGNDITVIISNNEHTTEERPLMDVTIIFDGSVVEEFVAVSSTAPLPESDFIVWNPDYELALTAGTPLTGGKDGIYSEAADQLFLDKIEKYSFNTLARASTNPVIKSLYANFTQRLRDDMGVKFQCVLYQYEGNYEGVISVENKLQGEIGDAVDSAAMVYWTAGAEAGCNVNESLTNATYTGEYFPDTDYTQAQLEKAIQSGKLVFHLVGDDARVLEDINTLTEFTEDKGEDFKSNQTVRVLDQIGNDIACIFNTKYLGKIPNDAAGRVSLWNDITSHHRELEAIRAIENFQPDKVSVEKGGTKKSVVVTDYVTPTNAMCQLYMSVIVE